MKKRILKFRSWIKKQKIMLPPENAFVIFSNGAIHIPFEYKDFMDENDLVLMQYTGLKDKNGKEIWEGDIILDLWKHKLQIIYSGAGFLAIDPSHGLQYEGSELDPEVNSYNSKRGTFNLADRLKWAEVIGNVFENPDLLK